MTTLRFFCNRASTSCMALVKGIRESRGNCLRIKRNNSTYGYPSSHLVVNWGSTGLPSQASNVLNGKEAVRLASKKIETFAKLVEAGVPAVPYTTEKDEALEWIEEEDDIVFCRTKTSASQGRGIVVAHDVSQLVSAPLYTKYVESSREARVHVFKGEVIDFTQKRKLSSESRNTRNFEGEPDMYVKNLDNGWIFSRVGVELPDSAKQIAVDAVEALGLDFGAVDMLVDPDLIIEINSAPGLEGTTLERYIEAFGAL